MAENTYPKRIFLTDLLLLLLCFAVVAVFFIRSSENLGYNWQFYRIPKYFFNFEKGIFSPGIFVYGIFETFKITAISFLLSFIFGLCSAIFNFANSFSLKMLSFLYVETIRNTPLLIQIFFNYFVVAPIFGISPFVTAVLSLSLFEGAYASEIIRGAINSIPTGQWEASRSLGMKKYQTYIYIILPQALKAVIPPLTSLSISLVKDSALVSTISVYELTMYGQAVVSETFLSFEVWFTIALIYLIINLSLSFLIKFFTRGRV